MKNSLLHAIACSLIIGVSIHAGQGEVSQSPQAGQPSRLERCKAFLGRNKGKLLVTAGALSLYGLCKWYQGSITTQAQPLLDQADTLFKEYLSGGALEKAFAALDNSLLEELKTKYAHLNSQEYIDMLTKEYQIRVDLELLASNNALKRGLVVINEKPWSGFNQLIDGMSPELKSLYQQTGAYWKKMIQSRLGEMAAQGTLVATGAYTLYSAIRNYFKQQPMATSEVADHEANNPVVA